MKTCDLYWLAGLMEGEGWFTLDKKNGRPGRDSIRIGLTMTDEDVVRRAADIAQMGHVTGPHDKGPGNKPQWLWRVGRQSDVRSLMADLYPLLGKRRQERCRFLLTYWHNDPFV